MFWVFDQEAGRDERKTCEPISVVRCLCGALFAGRGELETLRELFSLKDMTQKA